MDDFVTESEDRMARMGVYDEQRSQYLSARIGVVDKGILYAYADPVNEIQAIEKKLDEIIDAETEMKN